MLVSWQTRAGRKYQLTGGGGGDYDGGMSGSRMMKRAAGWQW